MTFYIGLTILQKNEITKVDILVDKDKAGDNFVEKIKNQYSGEINDLRDEYELNEKVDLNDKLLINQIKNASLNLFKR